MPIYKLNEGNFISTDKSRARFLSSIKKLDDEFRLAINSFSSIDSCMAKIIAGYKKRPSKSMTNSLVSICQEFKSIKKNLPSFKRGAAFYGAINDVIKSNSSSKADIKKLSDDKTFKEFISNVKGKYRQVANEHAKKYKKMLDEFESYMDDNEYKFDDLDSECWDNVIDTKYVFEDAYDFAKDMYEATYYAVGETVKPISESSIFSNIKFI